MKKLLILFCILLLTSCTSDLPMGGDSLKEWEKPGKEHLKLKAPKDKVLFNKTVGECKKYKEHIANGKQLNVDCEEYSDVKHYLYISDNKIKKEKKEIDGVMVDEFKRTKNAIIYKKPQVFGGDEDAPQEYVAVFYGGSPFYQAGDEWYQTETSTTTIAAFEEQTATTTVELILSWFGKKVLAGSGDPIYSESGDGMFYRFVTRETWAVITAGVGTGFSSTATAILGPYMEGEESGDNFRQMRNTAYFFDTSAIPDTDTISSATFSLYFYENSASAGWDQDIIITDFTTADSAVKAADYQVRDSQQSNEVATRVQYTSIPINQYTGFSLTDLTVIDKTDTTGIGTSLTGLYDDIAPSGAPGVKQDDYCRSYASEQAGTNTDPKLVVVYSAAGGGAVTPDPVSGSPMCEL